MTTYNFGRLSRPVSVPMYGTECRRLIQDYKYKDPGTGFNLRVPAGFAWDGTSIPWLVRPLIGGCWNPQYEIAGMLHDYLYRVNVWDNLGRSEADRIFYNILQLEKVRWIRTQEMYYGVRVGGWLSYNKKPLGWLPEGF